LDDLEKLAMNKSWTRQGEGDWSLNQVKPVTLPFLTIIGLGFIFGAYFVLRYLGLWSENDTAVFLRAATALQETGSLDNQAAYQHGYAYPLWLTFLSNTTGVGVVDLAQLYTPILGSVFLSIFGYAAFRSLLSSDILGLIATSLLFLVPELVFTMCRGNHEKLTVSLILLALLALVRSFAEMFRERRWSIYTAWVIVFYGSIFTLASLNAFFASSLTVAFTLTFLFALLLAAVQLKRTTLPPLLPIVNRLSIIMLVSWILVALVTWYIYPRAGSILALFSTTLARLATLFLSFAPESNPYTVTDSDWVNPSVYHLLSSFRYGLLTGSFITWVTLIWKILKQNNRTSINFLLMLALYSAFGLQMAFAVIVDFINLEAGTNAQVRIYTYFVLFASPLFTYGLVNLFKRVTHPRRRQHFAGYLGILCGALAMLSFTKATLEPNLSNRWLFYRQNEVEAISFWTARNNYRTLWIGPDDRLRNAYIATFPTNTLTQKSNFVVGKIDSNLPSDALESEIIRANAIAWQQPLPLQLLENRVYDNGDTTISRFIPRTPFQR
jgi:hypothetical protein